MKYKVGDKVRIRSDMETDSVYGELHFWPGGMEMCAGSVVTIASADESDNTYMVEENLYFWAEEMLEDVTFATADASENA